MEVVAGQNGTSMQVATAPLSRPRARVMLFTDSFIHGGTERQLVETLRLLDRSKYDLQVGCLKRRGPFLADVQALGIPVTEFPITSLANRSTFTWMRKLVHFLREEKIDLVHSFDYYTNLFAIPAARWAGVPVVIASRRNLAHNRSTFERAALGGACRLADGIVANSRVAAGVATGGADADSAKVAVIYNAINPGDFRTAAYNPELRTELNLPVTAMIVGVLAALRPEKGHRTFLRAAAQVAAGWNQPRRELRFVLVGEGSEQMALQILARELGISDRVIFAGDRRNVADWLGALNVIVSPSDAESLPNAVLEAMASARPVVATRVGGVPEIVEEGATGLLVPPGDSGAMAAAILNLVSNEGLCRRMGAAGRARIEQDFRPERAKERLEIFYDRLLRKKRPTARILQIGNYPPPVCGWALHTQLVHYDLLARGADSQVLDIGPSRRITGRECLPVLGGFDYAKKLVAHRLRGFTFHAHVNADSWKGYALALCAVLLGRLTGKPPVLTFHAGPNQMYFPRERGFWRHAFRLLFAACGEIICNHEPVKAAIVAYGIPESRVHPIPAYSVQYSEEIPALLPAAVEEFLAAHEPRLFTYSLFRPEFTMDALFDAFAAVRERYPQAGLLLAGPGEIPEDARAALLRLHIDSAVLAPGNMPHAQFLTAVQRCDVFVRTHLRDGVCTSVLEALGLGIPVVASEDGLRPPSVVTFAPGDSQDLAKKLLSVLGDLPRFRAEVRLPEVDDNLDREVALLLRAGSGARA